MRILFISNYFPPEVNAPATRVYEHAKQWVSDGHEVEVLTSCPNFPEGEVYDGYENHLAVERVDGITVTRVPMYVTPNKGIFRRTLSYISFMGFARWYADCLQNEPDVLVATSPQFFAAIAGYWLARLKQVPFVLEIRDLWPESVVAVGAMERNLIIRSFERLEKFLYREADRIVPVTNAFKRSIVEKGIDPGKITVIENGVEPVDFNSYGSRRGNDRVMTRGTFANVRFKNQLAPGTEGGYTKYFPEDEITTIYDAAMRYKENDTPLVALAGDQYGTGSSRDWAAKGTILLGVEAVIATSYERIHRSNLVGMGVLPLQFKEGESADTLGLDGSEEFNIEVSDDLQPRDVVPVEAKKENGETISFETVCRIDTPVEIDYYRNGGILHYVLREYHKEEKAVKA
jgi:3-isopropylmalate dehydratase small subunit